MLTWLLSISITVWFFYAARAVGRNPFGWAVIGLTVFLVVSSACTVLVTLAMSSWQSQSPAVAFIGFVGLLGPVAVGGVAASLVRSRFLLRGTGGPSRPWTCWECRTKNEAKHGLCERCGAPFRDQAEAPADWSPAGPTTTQSPTPTLSPVTQINCWSCKHAIPVTSATRGMHVRCPKCGTKQSLPA